jgi:nucleotide-binding universal stress UspA family protein
MYRSLLVPLDGSSFGEHALPLALTIARRAGVGLEVVHVYQPVWHAEGRVPLRDAFDADRRAGAGAYLRRMVKRLKAIADVPVASALLYGPVVDVLGSYALDSLMVMATHGRSPLARFCLGSVTDGLVRRATRPLLLVRPPGADIDLAREHDVRQILIPLDGSPPAEQILAPAAALVELLAAEATLLQAIPPTAAADACGGVMERLRANAEEYLEAVAVRLRGRGLSVRVQVARGRHPARAILDTAAALPGGLLALATPSRGGLAHLLRGSVADTVVRGAALPVLVRRPRRPLTERVAAGRAPAVAVTGRWCTTP